MHIAVPNARQSQSHHGDIQVENVETGETIYQRCLLIKGRSTASEAFGDDLTVTVVDSFGAQSSPQSWPMSQGYFKALVLLSPGKNAVQLRRHHNSVAKESLTLDLIYIPLLQTPPLHLAIMIAKDSPMVLDCPLYKSAGIPSAHCSLDAAIVKFRTTAYMWQAFTAEDMRMRGLGRRSFRIDEEDALDTSLRACFNTIGQRNRSQEMGPIAKIHLVRSAKTTAEIRDPEMAQQNDNARRQVDLYKYFESALHLHGGVFNSSTRPVVAGLILDSHYVMEDELVLGHATLGCHKPDGLSLGIFGSHLTYSWPRCFDEIAASLTDTTPPGDSVCNDNGECETSWEACSIGQGAFLHAVGHAFGALHTNGIMARGYAQDWPKNFLSRTAYCAKTDSDGIVVADAHVENNAHWDPKDVISFRRLPHFRLPGDIAYIEDRRDATPSIRPTLEEGVPQSLIFECKACIDYIAFPAFGLGISVSRRLDLEAFLA